MQRTSWATSKAFAVASKWEHGHCGDHSCFVCPSVSSLSLSPTQLCAAALRQGWDDHQLESPKAQRRNEDPGVFPGPARPLWARLARSQHSANSSAGLHGIHLEHSWEQLDQGLSWVFSASSVPCCHAGLHWPCLPFCTPGQQPAGGAPVRVPCLCHEQGWSWGSVRAQQLVQMWGMDNARARYCSCKTSQENVTRCICYLLTLPRDFYHRSGYSRKAHKHFQGCSHAGYYSCITQKYHPGIFNNIVSREWGICILTLNPFVFTSQQIPLKQLVMLFYKPTPNYHRKHPLQTHYSTVPLNPALWSQPNCSFPCSLVCQALPTMWGALKWGIPPCSCTGKLPCTREQGQSQDISLTCVKKAQRSGNK